MGKRSDFNRVERDYYPTPIKAVEPLFPYLPKYGFMFWEPCAGDGRLISHIQDNTNGRVVQPIDVAPQRNGIEEGDALKWMCPCQADYIITNPPWDRKILHPMIDKFAGEAPTWLLFDADWMHTLQSAPYMKYCEKIVSVGRVKWIEDSKMTGKDNAAWYLFNKNRVRKTEFIGRVAK